MTFRHIYGGPKELRLANQHVRLNYSWLNELPTTGDPAYVRGIRDCAVAQGDLMRLFPEWFPPSGYTSEPVRQPWVGAPAQACATRDILNPALLFRAISQTYPAAPSLMCDTTGRDPLAEHEVLTLGRLGRLLHDGLFEGPNWVNVWCSVSEMQRLSRAGWHVATEFFPERDNWAAQADKLMACTEQIPKGRFCAILNWTITPPPDNRVLNRMKRRNHQIVVRDLNGVEYDAAELEEVYK